MKFRRYIFIFLSILVLLFIFLNSAQVSETSTDFSRGVTRWILSHFVSGFDELDAAGQQRIVEQFNNIVRKAAHFSEYALLGFVVTLLFCQYPRFEESRGRLILLAVVCCMVYAVTDEVHQLFVEGRTGRVLDVLIDTAGSAIGSSLAFAIHIISVKLRKQ